MKGVFSRPCGDYTIYVNISSKQRVHEQVRLMETTRLVELVVLVFHHGSGLLAKVSGTSWRVPACGRHLRLANLASRVLFAHLLFVF